MPDHFSLMYLFRTLREQPDPNIPVVLIENICHECKKRNIDLKDLNDYSLRRILKDLNYRQYYDYIPYIIKKIRN